MTPKHVAIAIVLITIAVALAWDAYVVCAGVKHASWCSALRDVNAASDGLVALCAVALWIHVFALPYLPHWWRHG